MHKARPQATIHFRCDSVSIRSQFWSTERSSLTVLPSACWKQKTPMTKDCGYLDNTVVLQGGYWVCLGEGALQAASRGKPNSCSIASSFRLDEFTSFMLLAVHVCRTSERLLLNWAELGGPQGSQLRLGFILEVITYLGRKSQRLRPSWAEVCRGCT